MTEAGAKRKAHHNLRHVLPPAEQAAALLKVAGAGAAAADAGERILASKQKELQHMFLQVRGAAGARAPLAPPPGARRRRVTARGPVGVRRRVRRVRTRRRPRLCSPPERPSLLPQVYGVPTSSFNNDWLRRKLLSGAPRLPGPACRQLAPAPQENSPFETAPSAWETLAPIFAGTG